MRNLEIREVETEDIGSLFDIRTSVVENHLSHLEMEEMGITEKSVADALATDSKAWIAVSGGEPVAFSMVDISDGSVFAMFVKPAYEGRGIGRALMAEAESHLFQSHEMIWLVTHAEESVRANGFYRKLGWQAGTPDSDGDVRYEKFRTDPVQ